jgi:hypothetical protein
VSKLLRGAGFSEVCFRIMDGSGHSCSRAHFQEGWDWLEPIIFHALDQTAFDRTDPNDFPTGTGAVQTYEIPKIRHLGNCTVSLTLSFGGPSHAHRVVHNYSGVNDIGAHEGFRV